MSVENPSNKPETGSKNPYVEQLEQGRLNATEVQKNIERVQSAKYGEALLTLMERTGNNREIVNGLSDLIDALSNQSNFGQADKPLAESRQKDLATFIGEATKALRWTVGGGNRPADMKIDLSKWEVK